MFTMPHFGDVNNMNCSEVSKATVVVRNTFIDVYTEPRRNRCNSMPASFGVDSDGIVGCWETSPWKTPLSPTSDASPPSTDASTDASGESAAGDCKEVDDLEVFMPTFEGTDPTDTVSLRVALAPPPAPPPEDSNHDTGQSLAGRSPVRSALNSRAKAWSPTSTAAAAGHRLQTFQAECQIVMNEIKAGVRHIHGGMDVELQWDGLSGRNSICKLTALCPEGLWGFTEHVKVAAQDVVVGATDRSASVCLIGGNRAPLVAEPQGFRAVFGEMRDKTRACWSMYSLGFCRRGGACRWKHPQAIVSFQFTVATVATPQPCLVYMSSQLQQQQQQQHQEQQQQQQQQRHKPFFAQHSMIGAQFMPVMY